MADAFTLESLLNLAVLLVLQAVLGFDNLLYISLQSQRVAPEKQAGVRRTGIVMAVVLRIVLLFVMIQLIETLAEPFYVFAVPGVIEGGVNFSTIIFVFGGGFLMYTAVKEINHLLRLDHPETDPERRPQSVAMAVATIVLMNLIFSFDSVLSALAITDVFLVLAAAIVLSGLGMLLLADRVSTFIANNRKYEVLGLFILLIVGIVLLGEAGHAAEPHLHLFGYPVEPMSKTTFYVSVVVLIVVDILQTGYRRKLERMRKAERAAAAGE